jgi:hypothetical protein
MIQDLNERFVARFIGGTVRHYDKKRKGCLEPPTKETTPPRTQQKSLYHAAYDLFMCVMNAYVNSTRPMPDKTRDVLARLKQAYQYGNWKQVWDALEASLENLKNDPVASNEAVKRALLDVEVSQLMYPPQNH